MTQIIRNLFPKLRRVANNPDPLDAVQEETRFLQVAYDAAAELNVSLQRAEDIRQLTIAYNKAVAERDKAVRLHRRSAEEQKAVEVAFHRLFQAKREATRDAR